MIHFVSFDAKKGKSMLLKHRRNFRQLINRLSSQRRTSPRLRSRRGFRVEQLEFRNLLAASLSTDQADYAPGSDVTFTGTGYEQGETIDLNITSTTSDGDALVLTDGVTDGGAGDLDGAEDGNFTTIWNVGYDNINATLTATATGRSSGESASTTFTDAPPPPPGSLCADVTGFGAAICPNASDTSTVSKYNPTHYGQTAGTAT